MTFTMLPLIRRACLSFLCFLAVAIPAATAADGPASAPAARRTENVILVTLDGFRWQELFGGADEALLDRVKHAGERAALREAFWRASAEERRRALMPFFWDVVARQGQVFGDPASRSFARTANDRKFSYPGYSEMLCGVVDVRINSNDPTPNPNRNVLEFLNDRPGFAGKIAAFGTWNRLSAIVNEKRSGLLVHCGWAPLTGEALTPAQREVNAWIAELPRLWPDNVYDAVIARIATEHLTRAKPRVMYVMFGETDEWGHAGRYDCYLRAAHRNDAWLAEVWKSLQADARYAGKTSLVLTTDHGRGATARDWTDHGPEVAGAEEIWIAVIGPDTPALGLRADVTVTQSQVAGTIAVLLGEDFVAAHPQAAAPLPGVTAR